MKRYNLYVIVFPNGKLYYGISADARTRFEKHKSCARNGSRLPVHCAIRKYGGDNVRQRILCVGSRDYIADLEIKMIGSVKTQDRQFGYNITNGGDISPMHAPGIAARVAETKRALFADEDYKNRTIGPAIKASLDPVIRARMLESIRKPEVSAAKSAKLTGRKASQEALANMRAAQACPDHRERLSTSVRAAWADPALRAQQSERFKGREVSAEQRAKISASLMGHPGFGKGEKRPEISEMLRNSIWITNGAQCRRVPKGTVPQEGWRYGKKLDRIT